MTFSTVNSLIYSRELTAKIVKVSEIHKQNYLILLNFYDKFRFSNSTDIDCAYIWFGTVTFSQYFNIFDKHSGFFLDLTKIIFLRISCIIFVLHLQRNEDDTALTRFDTHATSLTASN